MDCEVGMAEKKFFVHPSSYVDEPCEIGEGTKIWHFCHVMRTAKIGEDCILGQNVFVGPHVIVGNGCKIQNNVSLYEGVILEEGVFCGPSMVFTNVINPRSAVERKDEFKQTLVKKGATIGANATVICGVTIGRYAFIGAGATVTKDVPDYALAVGVPAQLAGWMCYCGVRLPFDPSAEIGEVNCPACDRVYMTSHDRVREKRT